ncbi:hypothetical protein [Pedobacter sp. Leaf194]|uniref:hypothetical protein n=1 Tax=Pedobacter sp. Leaf194 TaxID=1736297 RepID=UPI000A693645|nr:hypothetical protein [Pedobacter sp. Leaf194]
MSLKPIRHYLLKPLFLILMYGAVFPSCRDDSKLDYIISKEDSIDKALHTRSDGVVLLPTKVKFGRDNFIIDSNDNVYFYSFQEPKEVAGVFDGEEDNSACLKPNGLLKIPKGLEPKFFEENVILQKSSEKIKTINVASFNDTISTDFINFLKEIQHKDSSSYSLRIRRVIPEEIEVMRFKILGRHYIPHYRKEGLPPSGNKSY